VRVLILASHLVEVGDRVLHDAGRDVRHPTRKLPGRTRRRAWRIV
jgi:hypothetical protein